MVAEVRLPAADLVTLSRRVALQGPDTAIAPAFEAFGQAMQAAGIEDWGRETALFRMLDGEMEVVVGVPWADEVPGLRRMEIPETRALHLVHEGPLNELPQAHEALHRQIAAQGLAFGGWDREVYRSFDPESGIAVCDVYADLA